MSLNDRDLTRLCEVAETAARAAGEYIQSQVDRYHTRGQKSAGTSLASQVVTAVDLKAQEIILSYLQESIKEHDFGLLTEEEVDDQSRIEKAYFWCVDPLDGTLPFTEGRSGYAISIALVTKTGDPIVGVVYVPDLSECYTSVKGKGVKLNGESMGSELTKADELHVYLDRSFQSESYFESMKSQLEEWAEKQKLTPVQYHFGFGAVRNAIGAMTSSNGCYFKFPKKEIGGGSIWDFAATRLFFEELGFPVSDAANHTLKLNNPSTTFMNECGVLYATDEKLSEFIVAIGVKTA